MFEDNILAIPSGSVLNKKQTEKLSEVMPFKEITDDEIAEMFGISIDELKKEIECGDIQCFAKDDKIWILPVPNNRTVKVVYEGAVFPEEFIDKFNDIQTGYPISTYDFEKITDGVETK